MFLSISRKGILPGWFSCSISESKFPTHALSPQSGVFFQQLLLKTQNHIDQSALNIQKSLRGVL